MGSLVNCAKLLKVPEAEARYLKREAKKLRKSGYTAKAVSYTHLTLPTTPYV